MSDKIREAQRLALSFAEKSTASLTANAHIRGLCKLIDVALAQQPAPVVVPADYAIRARVVDLLHLLQFAKIETPSAGDAAQAEIAMNDLERMLAASPAAPAPFSTAKQALNEQEPAGVYREDGEGFGFAEWKNGAPANGSLLYTAPPAAEQPDTVKVSRELLEHIAKRGVIDDGMNFCPECGTSKEAVQGLRALLAGGDKA